VTSEKLDVIGGVCVVISQDPSNGVWLVGKLALGFAVGMPDFMRNKSWVASKELDVISSVSFFCRVPFSIFFCFYLLVV
jgi:hypothetical protein